MSQLMTTGVRAVFAVAAVAVLSLGLAGFAASSASAKPAKTVWLCKPTDTKDPCHTSRTTTVINADGSTSVEKFRAAKRRPIDCFYVYPTVSQQQTTNADLTIDPEEKSIASQQASRLGSTCKVYAPMYRQLTLVGIGGSAGQVSSDANVEAPYMDVQNAFFNYIKKYSHGRGFILIGHSQGAVIIKELIKRQIDKRPNLRKRMLTAFVLGGNVAVKKGSDVGGDFKNVHACHSARQLGCVVAYSSFSADPPADALFGRVNVGPTSGEGQNADTEKVLCTNPANLSGGSGKLQPYFGSAPFDGVLDLFIDIHPDVPTAWGSYPGLYTGKCMNKDGASWLQVTAPIDAGDPRPVGKQTLGPAWGLHLSDVNIAWGNIVSIAKREIKAYAKETTGKRK